MGTHIDCIIPKEKDYSVEEIKSKLQSVYNRLQPEYSHLEKYGTFTKNVNGDWWISLIPAENGNPEYITGEGNGFRIDVYDKVIHIGSIERFFALIPNESQISDELYEILFAISREFRDSDEILIGQGGFGDSDYIMDMALEGCAFDQICKQMTELNGNPASDLSELVDKVWYLKK